MDFLSVNGEGEDGEWRYCSGPVFSYYEFKQPMADRLTDEAWAGDAPGGYGTGEAGMDGGVPAVRSSPARSDLENNISP